MPIKPLDFYNLLSENNIDFFTGVPDSLLKEFCFCVDENKSKEKHIIAANEGNAIALAAGYYLATNKVGLVYMQNSGLGNAINPLLSLCDPDVYSIPMIIMIGWRGEPGTVDEPQHLKQGKVQTDLLKAMGIPYEVISKQEQDIEKKVTAAINKAVNDNTPSVILVKKDTFDKYNSARPSPNETSTTREEFLDVILAQLSDDDIVVSTTGKTSREIFEIRERNNIPHCRDFLAVGSMGHCSSIAMGIAVAKPNRKIICIDGDGSLIMHMGSLTTVGKLKPKNFYHILINNNVHESVGGQETSIKFVNLPEIVKANGYQHIYSINSKEQLADVLEDFLLNKGPNFLEIKVEPGSRTDLGRPTVRLVDSKKAFMRFLSK
ncbi:MAG: phosphonopyruvate decarboxylase [Planctomycetes bacterium]|nr:phosphonopyruvate decarboxylase [Planctomycetota bacterium]